MPWPSGVPDAAGFGSQPLAGQKGQGKESSSCIVVIFSLLAGKGE